MLQRSGLFRVLFVVLVIISLLSLGGYLGWSQGYTAGVIAADGSGAYEGGARPVPLARPYYYGYGFFPIFFGFGLFFKLIFILFIIFLISRLFRFWAWGGPWGRGWGGPHARHHHHGPPWSGERPDGPDDIIRQV
jgi:hypothetical protein